MTLSSLAWLPGGFTRFVFPKLLLVALACLIATTLPLERRLPRRVTTTLAVGAALITIAALAGATPVASLVGRWPRYEGVPVLGLYAGSVWLGARIVGSGPIRAIHLAHALCGTSLILFACSLADVLGHSPLGPTSADRSGSLLGNATDQGLVAMMAAIVIVAVAADRLDPFLLVGAMSSVATVALSGSRTALVLTVAGVALAVGTRSLGHHRDRRLLLTASGLMTILAITALAIPTTRDRLLSPTTGSGRLLQWRLTLRLVVDHPLLGLGPSRYVDAFGQYESSAFVRFSGPRTLADSPHDLLLQTAVAGGLPLLACLLVLIAIAVRRAATLVRTSPESWGPALAAAAYGLAMIANFTSAGSTCLAAFLAGAAISEPVLATTDSPRGRRGAAAVSSAAFAGVAALMAMSCVTEVLLSRGVIAAAQGQSVVARRDVESAHLWRPLDGDVPMLGAQALAAGADAGDRRAAGGAVALSHQSLSRTPDSYASLVAGAVGLIAERRLPAARTLLDQAVTAFPHRPDAYAQRGLLRAEAGDVEGARADLRRALTIEPDAAVVRGLLRRLPPAGSVG